MAKMSKYEPLWDFIKETGSDCYILSFSKIEKIVGVVANNDFTLTIHFDNGETRFYDMRPFLKPGTVFEPFTKMENFRRVYVDDTHCVAWNENR